MTHEDIQRLRCLLATIVLPQDYDLLELPDDLHLVFLPGNWAKNNSGWLPQRTDFSVLHRYLAAISDAYYACDIDARLRTGLARLDRSRWAGFSVNLPDDVPSNLVRLRACIGGSPHPPLDVAFANCYTGLSLDV